MKYKELKKVAREKGYDIETNNFRTILKKQALENDSKDEIIISEIDSWNIELSTSLWFPRDFKLLEAVFDYAKTPLEERREEKRYIIPLPHLVTTDGEQQYLTHKGSFFASRRDKELRQTWKEEHLKYVPEEYRKYAVEVEEWK